MAIDYIAVGIENGKANSTPLPDELLAQTRRAARYHISLGIIIHRCMIIQIVISDAMVSAIQACRITDAQVQQLVRDQAHLCERLVTQIRDEYQREARKLPQKTADQHGTLIKALLDGGLCNLSHIPYDFGSFHIGSVVAGSACREIAQAIATTGDFALLAVQPDDHTTWAWFGRRDRPNSAEIGQLLEDYGPADVTFAVGEPQKGLRGWRLTHRQAKATLPVALRARTVFTRYEDSVLLAAMIRDDLLATSICERYLYPLEHGRDYGRTTRETLQAYLAADQNTLSAAAALGVSRRTVTNRLRAAERAFGRSVANAAGEIEAALAFRDLDPFENFSR